MYFWQKKGTSSSSSSSMEAELSQWQTWRQEERTGRIRAEVKLRTALKEIEQLKHQQLLQKSGQTDGNANNSKSTSTSSTTTMLLQCIGTVHSPYKKRMGTPRQPQLVPSSRGVIDMVCQAAALDGMDEYSHVWIIFEFHANTDAASHKMKTKIRPPRAGGKKVGQLATRSPHRPNCLGLSLVKVEKWDATARKLHIMGLDLVNGTPVYDIKPCVPWDIPNFYQNKELSKTILESGNSTDTPFYTPAWVTQEDALSSVIFSDEALEGLEEVVEGGYMAPFYTKKNNGVQLARESMEQILAQDPRSSHTGLKTNARGTTSDHAKSSSPSSSSSSSTTTTKATEPYSFLFADTRVYFQVPSANQVEVLRVIPFDTDKLLHADGIPLVAEGLGD